MNGGADGQRVGGMDGQREGWMDGQTEGGIDGWMEGWRRAVAVLSSPALIAWSTRHSMKPRHFAAFGSIKEPDAWPQDGRAANKPPCYLLLLPSSGTATSLGWSVGLSSMGTSVVAPKRSPARSLLVTP